MPTNQEYLHRLEEEARKHGATPEASWAQDLERTYQGSGGQGGRTSEDIFKSILSQQQARGRDNAPREEDRSSGSGGGGGDNTSERWPSSPYEDAYTQSLNQQNQMMQQMWQAQQARDAEQKVLEADRRAKADSLYGTLLGRSQQATAVTPEDPIIKAQVDAYRAEQERALRNLRSDAAEGKQGLRPTQDRMAGERVAQGVAGMQAELLSRELSSRRAEIADALASMGGILGADQVAGLQREIAGIDNLIRQQQAHTSNRGLGIERELGLGNLGLGYQQLGVQRELGLGGLNNDLLRTMLQNQQFYGDLGLRNRTQDDYFNLTSRGRLGNPIR